MSNPNNASLHCSLLFSLCLLGTAGCSITKSDNRFEIPRHDVDAPNFEQRLATSYNPTYVPTEPIEHMLLWEHAIKDMDFITPKHIYKTKSAKRVLANKRYCERQLNTGKLFLYHIVRELKLRNMPLELAVIPIIESNFNPKAISPLGAKGIWQFMPGTAKHFHLQFNQEYDMRLDIIASTNAALNYFNQLFKNFGDWNLAIAAYNVGPGTMQKAIRLNKKSQKPIDLWHLPIPQAGIEYVERLYAYTDLMRKADKYKVKFPQIKYQPVFKMIELNNRSLIEVAKDTGISIEILKKLNPGFMSITSKITAVNYVLIPVSGYHITPIE